MLESSKVIRKKLKDFSRADQEAPRIRQRLKYEVAVFVNQIHRLLRDVLTNEGLLDEDVLDAMTKDGDHEGWKSPDMIARLELYFGRNYESYNGIVAEAAREVEYLRKEIEAFDGMLGEEDGTKPGRREKLSSRMRVTFDQTKCDKALQSLQTSNANLAKLREQQSQLKQPSQPVQKRSSPTLSTTGAYGFGIRQAARALHQGLSDNLHNGNHDVRLFVQSIMPGEEIVMSIVLRCADDERPLQNVVQVRSHATSRPPTPPPESSTRSSCVEDNTFALRRVKWSDQLGAPTQVQRSEESNRAGQRLENRARSTNDLCLKLCHGRGRKGNSAEDECLCYVETHMAGEAFRHNFHPSDAIHQGAAKPVTLESLLVDYPVVKTVMTKRDQLMLARALVLAVLYLGSSPWLPDFWVLGNLSYFPNESGNLRASLRTVHLGGKISGTQPGSQGEAGVDDSKTPPYSQPSETSVEDMMLEFGVRNVALHYLGVVLLQIDRWQLINPDDLPQVRKLAKQRSELEADYGSLIERCLYCDFGVDGEKDLSRPKLWQAVYQDVVEKLDRMINLINPFVD